MKHNNKYISQWMICGPQTTLYEAPVLPETWNNQLEYEQTLRKVFHKQPEVAPMQNAAVGEISVLKTTWDYYYNHGNYFIDFSTFYSLLTHVKIIAETVLVSEISQSIDFELWAYPMCQVWLNGKLVAKNDFPVYKPMKNIPFKGSLNKGENRLTIVSDNLGVRDTRDIFGISYSDNETIFEIIPENKAYTESKKGADWLSALECKNGMLITKELPPFPAEIEVDNNSISINATMIKLPETTSVFYVKIVTEKQILKRPLQCIEFITPKYYDSALENPIDNFCKTIAASPRLKRPNDIHFSVYNVLARYAYNSFSNEDELFLLEDLNWVEKRIDCADFLVIGLLRLIKNYPLSEKIQNRIKEVLCNFRYWMDEKGSDGMCFWSENHALMFYGSQMTAGELYYDEIFSRSGRTGKEQYEKGLERCKDWLTNVENEGLEEFNSATYMPVTIAALLHLIDFAPHDESLRAKSILDSVLKRFCTHIFDKSIISPQGRVYRDVLSPTQQTAQGLLNVIFPEYPYSTAESMWYSCFLTSKYTFPVDLKNIVDVQQSKSYTSANVRINLEKTKNYILTSVDSPRAREDSPNWKNLCFEEGVNKDTNMYVKSLNECFHGTSVIEPGVFGYQQHLWYAALSSSALIFVSNPGSYIDCDAMRPGYWHGNLVFPAIKQNKNELVCVYNLPEDISVQFTHVYFPKCHFDVVEERDRWIFASKGKGLLALWCSGDLVSHNDVLFDCEYRCYDTSCAYVCVCSDTEKEGSMKDFIARILKKEIQWDRKNRTLNTDILSVQYIKHENPTQYI